MGQSAGAKNVNSELQGQYNNYSGGSSPFTQNSNALQGYQSTARNQAQQQYGNLSNLGQNFATTGGLNPQYAGGVNDAINNIGNNLGTFQNFASTGGFTPTDEANFRAQSNSVIPSMFSALNDKLQNQNTLNNGLNPGYNDQMAKASRDEFQQAQQAGLGTETNLASMIRQNKMQGAQGLLSGNEAMLQGRQGLLGASQQGQQMGMNSLNNLYNTQLGQGNTINAQQLQAMGLNADQINSIMGNQSQRNSNTPMWQQMMGPILGAAGTAAGAAFGGPAGASMGGKLGSSLGGGDQQISGQWSSGGGGYI
jgi:hypothetical protein